MIPRLLISLAFIAPILISCSSETPKQGSPAFFKTKAEAENAAKDFGCSGAHQMGANWMPCKNHNNQKKTNIHNSSGHNHTH